MRSQSYPAGLPTARPGISLAKASGAASPVLREWSNAQAWPHPVLLVASWGTDTFAFHGPYGRRIWHEAQIQGHSINTTVTRFLHKALSF